VVVPGTTYALVARLSLGCVQPDELDAERASLKDWGTLDYALVWVDQFTMDGGVRPSGAEIRHTAKLSRQTCTPDVALELCKIWWDTDVRPVLPAVQAPTLLIVGEGGRMPAVGRYVESLMPNAQLRAFPLESCPTTAMEIERWCRPVLETMQRFVGIGGDA
jgi:pimeloyl-ACP methyl ester carboxylesterase